MIYHAYVYDRDNPEQVLASMITSRLKTIEEFLDCRNDLRSTRPIKDIKVLPWNVHTFVLSETRRGVVLDEEMHTKDWGLDGIQAEISTWRYQ